MRDAFGAALTRLVDDTDGMVVLDGDNATSTRTAAFAQRRPRAFFNVGIAEQNLVGIAAGLALAGARPVACAFASMLVNRALDQVTHAVAYQQLGVVLAGHYAGLSGGREGACHHAISDLAALRSIPHLTLLLPACDDDVEPMLRHALRTGRPCYLRLHRNPVAPLPEPDQVAMAAHWRYWGPEDPEVLIVACGPATAVALSARTDLGGSTGVLNPVTLSPLPHAALTRFTARARSLVTVEEHSVVGGLGSAVGEWAMTHRPLPCTRIGIPREFTVSGAPGDLMDLYGITRDHITSAVEKTHA